MCLRYKTFFFLNFATGICIVILLCTAVGTTHWIDADLKRNSSFVNGAFSQTATANDGEPAPNKGFMHFGVVRGCKIFNYGFGARDYICFSVFEEHEGVYPTWLPILVIVCMVISAVFALVATIFGMVNSITVPIETVHGPKGLFYWNGFGGAFSAIALFTYVGLYYETLQFNVLNDVDTKAPNYFVTESADYGYSFWLLVVTFGLFSINIILLIIAHLISDPNFQWRKKAEQESNQQTSEVGLGIMY
ncbi:clarin-3-like isoform X1 [Anneissia japonica]|uniref:clarin-3-like isoform X1 n=1 Tax=Anneissia japonica TaxID=1529436 RepID=UPI001425AA14|nr:clarin-3-like isoform X1 [Anneissia japonica]